MSAVVVPLRRPRRSEPSHGWVHVHRHPGGVLVVEHESASGESFSLIDRFEPDQLEQAVAAALGCLRDYGSARLGMVALPLELAPEGGRAS